MFTGIVESLGQVVSWQESELSVKIQIEKPTSFENLKIGDSIAVNGVCLTLENVGEGPMAFTLGYETLRVLKLDTSHTCLSQKVNLERSLTWGGRVDGHFLTGHVDDTLRVAGVIKQGESLILEIELPEKWWPYVWPKGSLGLNGVSLTINQVTSHSFFVCLIPETLKRTNLSHCQVGDVVNFEADNMARGLVHNLNFLKGALVRG